MSVDVDRFWAKVRLGEDTDLELKEVRFRGKDVTAPKRHDLADGLAAFANAAGGWLVLGVSDDRTAQPLDAAQLDAVVHLVTEICSDSIEPALDPGLHRMPLPETAGAGVLLVDIQPGASVHRSPGGYLRRRGDSKRHMEPAEIRRLLQARGSVRCHGYRPPGCREHQRQEPPAGAVATVRQFTGQRRSGDSPRKTQVPQGRSTRGAPRDRRRRPPRGRRSARVAAERLHPGRVLRQRQNGRQPATRRPGYRGPSRRADARRDAVRDPQPEGGRAQAAGSDRLPAVQ